MYHISVCLSNQNKNNYEILNLTNGELYDTVKNNQMEVSIFLLIKLLLEGLEENLKNDLTNDDKCDTLNNISDKKGKQL